MAELKTKPHGGSVADFLAGVADESRRADCRSLVARMRRVTGEKPVMWGPSIVGFGRYHCRYASGHEGESCLVGFSPRKGDLTVYLMPGFAGAESALLTKLGKHKTSQGGCLYLKRLADVDLAVLEELVRRSVEKLRRLYPAAAAAPEGKRARRSGRAAPK